MIVLAVVVDLTRRALRVAAIAQGAVLPRPPPRLGDLHIPARYVPAEDEAMIGGDLYQALLALRRSPG